jgi:hypothetical protein
MLPDVQGTMLYCTALTLKQEQAFYVYDPAAAQPKRRSKWFFLEL